jgi:hypothetical protein
MGHCIAQKVRFVDGYTSRNGSPVHMDGHCRPEWISALTAAINSAGSVLTMISVAVVLWTAGFVWGPSASPAGHPSKSVQPGFAARKLSAACCPGSRPLLCPHFARWRYRSAAGLMRLSSSIAGAPQRPSFCSWTPGLRPEGNMAFFTSMSYRVTRRFSWSTAVLREIHAAP